MGENEKLGFTCEEVPFDFSTFNRFFGATTPWVDGEKSATMPRNSSKLLEVGKFPVPKGIEQKLDTINKEILLSNLVGRSVVGELPNWVMIYEDEICYAYNTITHEKILIQNPKPHKNKNKHYKPKFTL